MVPQNPGRILWEPWGPQPCPGRSEWSLVLPHFQSVNSSGCGGGPCGGKGLSAKVSSCAPCPQN